MKAITKKKDGQERTIEYAMYPENMGQLCEQFTQDEIFALADSALTIRLQAVLAANMDKTDETICKAFAEFKPGKGHGGSGRKQSLIASILEADKLKIFTGDLLETMKIVQLEDILSRLTK